MPPLFNIRREKFAQGLADGLSGAESYRRAGYRGKGHSAEAAASTMLKNVEVRGRMSELQGRTAIRAEITRDSLIADLEEARRIALSCDPPQSSAAVAASMAIAKLTGLLIDRRQVEIAHKPAFSSSVLELSEDEWRRQFDPQLSKSR